MKKIALLLLGLAALSANAQIAINNDGKTLFGEIAKFDNSRKRMYLGGGTVQSSLDPQITVVPGLPGNDSVVIDSNAPLVVLGTGTNNSKGYISFGDSKYVSIGESGSDDSDGLGLYGYGGLTYASARSGSGLTTKTIFNFNPCKANQSVDYTVPFVFYTDLKVNGIAIASDMRLKRDVEEIGNSATSLMNITPISYKLNERQSVESTDGVATKASASAEEDGVGAKRVRYGFVAQEVKEIFPDLVTEDEEGYLAVDYIGFIPLLVDAVKSLQAKVDGQEEIIETFEGTGKIRRTGSAGVESLSLESVVLGQNKPNPFNVNTVIEYTLPESVVTANLYIYDLRGTQLRSVALKDRGASSVTIEASTLQPGMYIYTLVADGMELDSKRMIITD